VIGGAVSVMRGKQQVEKLKVNSSFGAYNSISKV